MFIRAPIRRICTVCCARTANGHPAAVPPSNLMNSRRFIAPPHNSSATVGFYSEQGEPAVLSITKSVFGYTTRGRVYLGLSRDYSMSTL
jgi:hypothetical protein